MTPSPLAPPPPPPKRNGCLIALLIIGGIGVLIALISAVALYRAASSPEGQKVMKAVGQGVKLASKGLNAPGAAEVREAGCPEAMVLDLADLEEMIELFSDAGTHPLQGQLVLCQGFGELPDCAEVAKVYRAAPGVAAAPFSVTVKDKGSRKDLCSRKYDRDGVDIGPFAEKKRRDQ